MRIFFSKFACTKYKIWNSICILLGKPTLEKRAGIFRSIMKLPWYPGTFQNVMVYVSFFSRGDVICGWALPRAADAPNSGDQCLPQGSGRYDQHP